MQANDRPGTAAAAIYRMAASFARPVARGWMTIDQARAAIVATTARAARLSELEHEVADVAGFAAHILGLTLQAETDRRNVAAVKIERAALPLLRIGARSNLILATAHDANDCAGFPLEEQEVDDLAAIAAAAVSDRGRRRNYG